MAGAKVKVKFETGKVRKAAHQASLNSLGRAGAYVRGIAKKSIKVARTPSAPGKPPHTRRGRLKNAIFFAVDKSQGRVVIGPMANAVGKIGHTHEFGGTEPPKKTAIRQPNWKLAAGGHGPIRRDGDKTAFANLQTSKQVERAKAIAPQVPAAQGGPPAHKARHYQPRQFMGPALLVARERLPALWLNSVQGR